MLLPVAVLALVVSAWTIAYGPIRWNVNDTIVVRNSSALRPMALGLVLLIFAVRARDVSRTLAAALLVLLLPVTTYPAMLERLDSSDHPLRTLRDCVVSLREPSSQTRVYLAYDLLLTHSFFYYLHAIGPWTSDLPIETTALRQFLFMPDSESVVLLPRPDYGRFVVNLRQLGIRGADGNLPGVKALALPFSRDVVILLPGPFESCTLPVAMAGPGVEQVAPPQ